MIYYYPSILVVAASAYQFALPTAQDWHVESTNSRKHADNGSQDFANHHPFVATPEKDVTMMIGTTGGFGFVLITKVVA
jgi:hypothetical protein